MEQKFIIWAASYGKKDKTPLQKITIDNYADALKVKICNIKGLSVTGLPTSKNIFYITNPSDLDALIKKLSNDSAFKVTNNKHNGINAAALQCYLRFLQSLPANPSIIFEHHNLIVVGAPGTGKSYILNQEKNKFGNNFERVTFHPDYSYSQFVGTYKPVSDGASITYEYVPGPFLRVLVKAYKKTEENHLLLIEEINRANVAAVFGEVFQLLDRDSDGKSEYCINTSEDMRRYLQNELPTTNVDKIIIPSNMYIWATMNGADQGVSPMDTAFKRRWDFIRIGINENADTTIEVNIHGETKKWNDIRVDINNKLLECNVNEDKLLGPYFISKSVLENADKFAKANNDITDNEFDDCFKNKVLMYLFDDAAKQKRVSFFGDKIKTFSDLCEDFYKNGWSI